MSNRLSTPVVFGGNYPSWAAARAASRGYDSPEILRKVVEGTRKVESGEAAYERDSVVFGRIEYSLPLLACLLYVASRLGNRLDLIDIGGSLGSSFRQNRRFLAHLDQLRWSVVEQSHFVAAGRAEFETQSLRFYDSIDECMATERPLVAVLSGVLQAVERPYDLLTALLVPPIRFVIVDRTQFFVEDIPERLTVEQVPSEIYDASYPSWFLNLGQFRAAVRRAEFEIVEEFDSWERWNVEGDEAQNKCVLLERREVCPEGGIE